MTSGDQSDIVYGTARSYGGVASRNFSTIDCESCAFSFIGLGNQALCCDARAKSLLTARHWGPGRRTRLAQAGVAVLLGVCVLALTSGFGGGVSRGGLQETQASEIQGREDDALVDVDKTPEHDTYCSVFGDPSECEKQRSDGMHLYWTPLQIRGELWKTMKALAELEMREHGHHAVHKKAAEEQAKVFQLFRETMAREVTDIHTLQEEMHQTHEAAFKHLSDELVQTAISLKNYTDMQLGLVNGKVTALSAKQEADSQAALVQIAERVSEIKARLAQLHNETMTHLSQTENTTIGVQTEMRASDAATDAAVKRLEAAISSLDTREASHFANASASLEAQVALQEQQRSALESQINHDVGELRSNITTQLDAEETAIQALLASEMDGASMDTAAVRAKAEAAISGIRSRISAMIASQDANNAEQERALALLRADLDSQREAALAGLDAADARVSRAFSDLGAAEAALRRQATGDKSFLLARVDGNVSALDTQSVQLREWARQGAEEIQSASFATQTAVDSARTGLKAKRDDDVLRIQGSIQDGLVSLNASLLDRIATQQRSAATSLATQVAAIDSKLNAMDSASAHAHDALVAKFALLQQEQAQNNAVQEGEIRAIQAGEAGEAALVAARQAGTTRDLTTAAASLAAVKKEIGDVQAADKSAWTEQISRGFAGLKELLSTNITAESEDIRSRISRGINAVRASIEQLSAASLAQADNGEQALAALSAAVGVQDEKDKSLLASLTRQQADDLEQVNERLDRVKARLEARRAQLVAEYARIAGERAADKAAVLGKIRSDTAAEKQALDTRVASAERDLEVELGAAMSTLRQGVAQAEAQARADFTELDSNVTDWTAARHVTNARLVRRLEELKQGQTDSAEALDSAIATLKQDLSDTDARLLASTTAVEQLQDHAALSLNHTLHASLVELSEGAAADLTSETAAVRAQLATALLALRQRILTLERSTNSTAKAVSQSVFALEQRIMQRDAATAAEAGALNQTADLERSQAENEMSRLSERIKQGGVALASVMATAGQERANLEGQMTGGISADLEAASAGFRAALKANRTSLHLELVHEVEIWLHRLKVARQSALASAADATSRLERLKNSETGDHALVQSAVTQLEASVHSAKVSAQQALTALKAGLAKVHTGLDTLSHSVTQEVHGDRAQIESRVSAEVAALQQNFSDALAAQKTAMETHIREGARTLQDKIAQMQASLASGAAQFNASLAALVVQEQAIDRDQRAQVAKLLLQRQRAASELQRSATALKGALAEAGGELTRTSTALESNGAQEWEALNAKLTTAVQALQAGTVQLGSASGAALNAAKDAAAAARTSVMQEREALKTAHATDSVEIRSRLASGFAAMKANVTRDIEQAVSSIHMVFANELQTLAANVSAVKARAAQDEQRLKARAAGLEATEHADDAGQEVKIKALQAKVDEYDAHNTQRTEDLKLRVQEASKELSSDITSLQQARGADKNTITAGIRQAAQEAQAALNAMVAEQSEQLKARIARASSEQEMIVAKQKEQDTTEMATLKDQLEALQARARAADASNKDALSEIKTAILAQNRESSANHTSTWNAVRQVTDEVTREEARQKGDVRAQLAAFRREVQSDTAQLYSNYAASLAQAKTLLQGRSRELISSAENKVSTAYEADVQRNRALAAKVEEVSTKQNNDLSQSKVALQGVKGQASGWAQRMLNTIKSMNQQLVSATSTQSAVQAERVQEMATVQNKLQALTTGATALQELQQGLARAKSEAEADDAAEARAFEAKASAIAASQTRLNQWRSSLAQELKQAAHGVGKEHWARREGRATAGALESSGNDRMAYLRHKLTMILRKYGVSRSGLHD